MLKNDIEAVINALRKPEDIMTFFDNHFNYGCIDVDGVRHIDSLGGNDFREKYRTLSLEASLANQIGACFEQTNVTKFLLDNMSIKNKTLCTRGYNEEHKAPDDLYLVHCYTIAFYDNEVLCVEHSDSEKRGIYRYSSENKAFQELHKIFSDKFRAHGALDTSVVEYEELIPGGLTFSEFNQWMNSVGIPVRL